MSWSQGQQDSRPWTVDSRCFQKCTPYSLVDSVGWPHLTPESVASKARKSSMLALERRLAENVWELESVLESREGSEIVR